jgi:hypothetical protein
MVESFGRFYALIGRLRRPALDLSFGWDCPDTKLQGLIDLA